METDDADGGAGADLVGHQRRTADDRTQRPAGHMEAVFVRRAPVVPQADAAGNGHVGGDSGPEPDELTHTSACRRPNHQK